MEIDYKDLSQFQYFAKNNHIIILKEEYLTNVILKVAVKNEEILKNISEKEIDVKKIQFIKEMYLWKTVKIKRFKNNLKNFPKNYCIIKQNII